MQLVFFHVKALFLTRLLPDLTETQRQALLQQCDNLDGIIKASVAQLRAVLGENQARLTGQRLRRLWKQCDSSSEESAQLPLVLLDSSWQRWKLSLRT